MSDIQTALKGVIGHSSSQRIQELCEAYVVSGDYNDIYKTLTAIEVLDERLRKLNLNTMIRYSPASTYSLLSPSPLQKAVRAITRGLEDLLLNAMEGADVSDLMNRRLMLYQVVPDITL